MSFSCHRLALMYKAAIVLMKASVGSIDRRTVQWLFFNSLSNALIAVGSALRAHWSAHSVWRRTISSPFPSPPHPLFFFLLLTPFLLWKWSQEISVHLSVCQRHISDTCDARQMWRWCCSFDCSFITQLARLFKVLLSHCLLKKMTNYGCSPLLKVKVENDVIKKSSFLHFVLWPYPIQIEPLH